MMTMMVTAAADATRSSSSTSSLSWLMSIDELLDALGNKMTELLVADRTDPHKISIGFIGGDIPIMPPFAALWLTLFWGLTWFNSITGTSNPQQQGRRRRLRFIPKILRQSMMLRLAVCAVMVATAIQIAISAKAELERVGTAPNFQQVPEVASQGPYAWTRNGLYISVLLLQLALAVGCDSGWMLLSMVCMAVYLDKIVIPAEEEFLARELRLPYIDYKLQVPRWIFFYK
jgi:protein-S-isoprenylcysteine O-methyltransferase Ste14